MIIAINGSNGRMGTSIKQLLKDDQTITSVVDIPRDTIGDFQGVDVIIDFSSDDGLKTLMQHASCKIVSGTTGLSVETFALMKQYGDKKNGIIWGSNTSLGVNLMFAMVKRLGQSLGEEYDAEIYERHHRMKKDAPSGTALTIGKKIAEGRGVDFNPQYGTQGERKTGSIGFAVERGGKTVGYHEARFISDDETLWFGHEAFNRSIFSKGAITIAKLAVKQNITGYHEVWDVLLQHGLCHI